MFRKMVDSLCNKLERSIFPNNSLKCKVVFGPVQSRRLGNVIGINNIKSNICSYNCVYCPTGATKCCSVCSINCLNPYELHLAVRLKLEELKKCGKKIEYIVFAGRSEATLDKSLHKEILLLREFGYKIAVFTNSSLLWNDNIQENLMFADYVSVRIDTVNEDTWHTLNRPHKRLHYDHVLNGIKQFSDKFHGRLTTETMLIKDINDNPKEIEGLANFLNSLKCEKSHFMTPIYPTSEIYAESPDEENLGLLQSLLKEKVKNPAFLCCPENEEFFASDDFESELLGLLSFHPIRFSAIKNYIRTNDELKKLNRLLEKERIKELNRNGKKYYAFEDSELIN